MRLQPSSIYIFPQPILMTQRSQSDGFKTPVRLNQRQPICMSNGDSSPALTMSPFSEVYGIHSPITPQHNGNSQHPANVRCLPV